MIVVAGEALVDLVIAPSGAVTAKLGGGPYNAARTIGRLGGQVTFLGSLSVDRFGNQLFDHLVADGVGNEAIVRCDLPTTLAAAELDDHGGATYRFYLQGTAAPALDHVPAAVAAPAAVHAGTLGLVLEPLATTVEHYLAQLPSSTLVFLDPNCRPRVVADRDAYQARLERLYLRADVVKLSTEDIEYLTPGSDPLAYATALLGAGPTVVLVTDGGAGAWAVTAHDETMVPVRPVEVADTIGVGDSFGGAFLAWWLDHGFGRTELHDHAAVVEAVDAAQEVAGVTCSRVGAEPPRRTELSARWQRAGG